MLTPNTISYYYFKPGAQTPYRDSATKNILPVIGVRTHAPIIDSRGRWLLPSVIPFFSFSVLPKFVGTGANYGSWIYRRNEADLPGPSPLVSNLLEPTAWHYFTLSTASWQITPDTTETRKEYSQVRALTHTNLFGYATERITYQASFPSVYATTTTGWTYALLQQWHQLTTREDGTIEPIQPVDPANGALPMLKTSRETACGVDSFSPTAAGPIELTLSGYVVNTTDHTSSLRSSASGDYYVLSGSSTRGSYQSETSSQILFGYLGRHGGRASFGLGGNVVIPKTFESYDGDMLYTMAATGRVSLHVYRSTNHSAATSTNDKESAIATVAHTFTLDQTIELINFDTALNKPSADTAFVLPEGRTLDLMANTPYLFRVVVEGTPIHSETTIEDPSAQLPLYESESISTSAHCQLSAIVNLELIFP